MLADICELLVTQLFLPYRSTMQKISHWHKDGALLMDSMTGIDRGYFINKLLLRAESLCDLLTSWATRSQVYWRNSMRRGTSYKLININFTMARSDLPKTVTDATTVVLASNALYQYCFPSYTSILVKLLQEIKQEPQKNHSSNHL